MKIKFDKNIVNIVVLVFFGLLTNNGIPYVAYLAVVLLSINVIKNNINTNIYTIMLLIPCIRIFDAVGSASLVNIVILLVGAKYIFLERKTTNTTFVNLATVILGILESMHWIFYDDYLGNEIFTTINIVFDIFVCITLVSDKNIAIDRGKMIKSLCHGVFISTVVYIMSNGLNSILYVLKGYSRFYAYGHDPNYFSIYILLSLFGIIVMAKKDIKNVIYIMLLTFLELATSSKMGLLCLGFIVCYLLFVWVKSSAHRKLILKIAICLGIAIYFMKDTFLYLIDKVVKRFTFSGGVMDLNTISSGRFDIVKGYLDTIMNSPVNFVFGYGLEYNRRMDTLVAHNTFLDVFLSWGIIGCLVVGVIILYYCKTENINFSLETLCFIIMFAFTLCSLSCLTSDMFWYLLFFVAYMIKKPQKEAIYNSLQ